MSSVPESALPASHWQWDRADSLDVPVAKPRLPQAQTVLPLLREIDANRWYSNYGPLNERFQGELSQHFGGASVVSCANATLGLAMALMAQDPSRGSLCAIPAWSFAASAHAAIIAGLVPWLIDVDASSHQLTPAALKSCLPRAPGRVGAVMPVMPFGAPMDLAQWDQFKEETGLAVVIDGAAAFDSLRPRNVPSVVSLHATKVLGIGEGGLVASTDRALIKRVVQCANFGFMGSREATSLAINGKLSEYGAAVGLAALAEWPAVRADFLRVGAAYRRGFGIQLGIALPSGFGSSWIASTCVVNLAQGRVEQIAARLAAAGVATRRWWGGGLHRHSAFSSFPRTTLSVSERLAERNLGLPCWRDLPDDTIGRICDLVTAVDVE